MSGINSSPTSDDKMMAYMYDDVDDADIFGFGDAGVEDDKTNDNDSEENRKDIKPLEFLNENQILKETIQKLKLEKDTLERKISEVYKTAKNEIERKDRRFQELQEHTNNILFRRNNGRGFGYSNVQVEDTKPLKRFTNEDFQQFNTDYKIPKKNPDNLHESEQKWIKSDVLGDSHSLTSPRRTKTVQDNRDYHDRSRMFPTTPSRDKRYQDNTRLRGCPPQIKLESQDDPKLTNRQRGRSRTPPRYKNYQDKPKSPPGSPLRSTSTEKRMHDKNTPSRTEIKHRSSSRSPQRHKNYQDRSRNPTTSARTPSRYKSRSKSTGNRVEADPRDANRKNVYPNTPSRKETIVTEKKHRSSSRSPQRHKNYQYIPRQTTRSPLRHKSRSTSGENSRKEMNREIMNPNSSSRQKANYTERNYLKSCSRSPQRHKNYQDRSRQTKPPRRSPIRRKSKSESIEAPTKDTNREREQSSSPSREHRSSSRSSQRHRNYQERPKRNKSRSASAENRKKAELKVTNRERNPLRERRSSSKSPQRHSSDQDRARKAKTPPGSPKRHKSRSASEDTNREREQSNSPSREHRSSSRSSQRHRQERPKPPPGSPKRNKSRSASAENRKKAELKVTNRERNPLRERRSSSKSPQRHSSDQDRPRKPKTPPGSPKRHKSRSASEDTNREREQSNSPSREHRSSSRSSQRHRNGQERPPRPPPRSPRRNKSRSASAENKGNACNREEPNRRNQERSNRFGPPFTRKTDAVRPLRTPSRSPPRSRRPRTPTRIKTDKRRQSRPSERGTRGRNIERRLGWGVRRGTYRRFNDSVERVFISRRQRDYRRKNEHKIRNIEQLRHRLKQRSIERDSEKFKVDKQECDYSGDEDTDKMTVEELQRLLREKEKELMAEEELSDIDKGQLTDKEKNIYLPKNAKKDEKCKKFDKSKKETYEALLKETKNITQQAQKDVLGIKKPQISPNVETKLLETIISPDAVDPRLNPTSCDSNAEKPRARINLEAYMKRREEQVHSDLIRIEKYQEIDIEDQEKSKESVTIIIAEIQKEDTEEVPIYIEKKSDNNDQKAEEEEAVRNIIESDYKYTPAVDDEDAELDIPEEKNSLNSFYDDFDISEDDDRFRKSDSSSAESKKKQAQKDILEIKTTEIDSNLESKDLKFIKSLDTEDSNTNPIVKDSQSERTEVANNFEASNKPKDVSSYLASVGSEPEVDITYKKLSAGNVELIKEHYEDKASENSDQKVIGKSVEKLMEPDFKDPPIIEDKDAKLNSIYDDFHISDDDDKRGSSSAEKVDNTPIVEENVKMLDKIGSYAEKTEIVSLPVPVIDVNNCEAKNPKVKILSNVVIAASLRTSEQVDPVKTIKKSPRSRKKVQPKQLLMRSEIVENEKVENQTVATKLEDLRHNNPSFIPYLPGDSKAFDTPNTYIMKKNEQKKKPAAKNSKATQKPKGKAKKREVFRIRLQTNKKKKKNYETSSSEFSSDSYSDCESPEPENNKKLKMEPKKKDRKPKTAQEKIEKVNKKPTNNSKSDVIEIDKPEDDILIQSEKITDDGNKTEDIEYKKTKTTKRNTAKTVKFGDNVKTVEKCDIAKGKSESNKKIRAKSVKVSDKIEAKVTDISEDKSENIENTNNKSCQVKLLKVVDNVVIAEENCKEDKSDNSENTEAKTNKRRETVKIEEKITVISEDNFKNNRETKIIKRNRAKPIKVVKIQETFSDNNKNKTKNIPIIKTITNKSQAKLVCGTTKAEEKITDHNEDKSENSENTKTNANQRNRAKLIKAVDTLKIEEKITDINEDKSKNSDSTATKRRRIQPTKVGEVTPSCKRKLDTQEDAIANKLPKLEQSPLPQMESMLKQLENKSSPQPFEQRDNKITAVSVEDGVVEININSKDSVFLGAMDQLFMFEDVSNYYPGDKKSETSFSNFQLKNLNTSTPKKPSEQEEDNVTNNLVENEIKEDKGSPVAAASVGDSPKEYLTAPLRRNRRKRIRVEVVTL